MPPMSAPCSSPSLRGPLACFVLVAALLPAAAAPQSVRTGTLEGVVISAETGVPIHEATIDVVGTPLQTMTGRRGRFALRGLAEGRVTIRASRLGYESRTLETDLAPGRAASLVVELVPEPFALDPLVVLSRRTRMVGDPLNATEPPGAAQFLTRREMEGQKLLFDNVHDFLRRLPGVNVQDEEGYGLRPNIGLRGTGVDRSSRITVMEDGVLVAPAPYAAPAAYYFPVAGRMEAVEVRKGSSQIRYGPRTVGGAVNLVSTSIPDELGWSADVAGGRDATLRAKGRVGGASERLGWLVETYQLRTDGFKELAGDRDTGFVLGDYVAKLRVNSRRDGPRYQEVELKLGYTDELSHETYLGLTEDDFRRSPLLRYPASQPDVMDARHRQAQVRWFGRLTDRLDLTTTAYHNDLHRNWYKLAHVLGTDIASVLGDPGRYGTELALLRGEHDSEADAFRVRANNRRYYSRGIQSVLGMRLNGGGLRHDVEVGLRLHRDQEDRFQLEDRYGMHDGSMVLTSRGAPGSQDNRVGEADALAFYVQDEIRGGAWTLTPGVRFETVDFTRTDYDRDDPDRAAPSAVRRNGVSAWIPGIGAIWALDPSTHLFGGVHRGFGPPGPGADDEATPESSVSYELGIRVRRAGVATQVAGFYGDYRNILGKATLATGESGAGELFNGGAVDVHGIEASLDFDLAARLPLPVRLPVTAAYTHTRATFGTSFESEFEPWGTVERGDRLPYLPEHQFSASVGVEGMGWDVTLSAAGSSRMRTRAGRGPILAGEGTDGYVTLGLGAEYGVAGQGALYAGVQNLLDSRYVVARRPAGARPGLPRTFLAGFRVTR